MSRKSSSKKNNAATLGFKETLWQTTDEVNNLTARVPYFQRFLGRTI